MSVPALADATEVHTQAGPPADELATGLDDIAPYRALRVLGRGGMGVVYLAQQSTPVLRQVALKVTTGKPSASLRSWFEIERHALARMRHPGIAQLLDAGELADGRPFFAMEAVEGEPLVRHCQQAHAGLRERVELLVRICHAVQHAHGKGLVHRDLKPSNILVGRVDGVAWPKLIDFGIASAVAVRGRAAGTAGYMSPEQASATDQVDTRSDIYALGVLLAELLGGIEPGEYAIDPSLPRPACMALYQARSAAARAAHAATLGCAEAVLARALRRDLAALVDCCTQLDPNRRLASAQQLAEELGRWLDGRPLHLLRQQRGYVLGKILVRQRWWLAGAAALLLGLGTALLVALQARAEAERQRDAALRAQAEAARQALVVQQVNRFLTDDLLGAANLELNPDAEQLTVRQLVEDSAQRLLADHGLQPEAAAAIQFALGRTLSALGRYALAEQAFRAAAAQPGQSPAASLPARLAAAATLIDQSDPARAQVELEALQAELRAAPQPALQAQVELQLGRHYGFVGDYPRALALTEAALGRGTLVPRLQDAGRTQRTWLLGRVGRHDEAIALQQQALAAAVRRFGADAWPTLIERGALATSLQRAQRNAAALGERERVIAAFRERFPGHAELGTQLSHYAALLLQLGRHEDARQAAQESISVLRRHFGDDHRLLGNAWSHLGAALLGLGDASAARTALQAAERIYAGQLPADHPLRMQNRQRLQQLR